MKIPANNATIAYARSAVAAPNAPETAEGKPYRMPSSMIKRVIGPSGSATPKPANSPRTKVARVKIQSCRVPPVLTLNAIANNRVCNWRDLFACIASTIVDKARRQWSFTFATRNSKTEHPEIDSTKLIFVSE